MKLKFKLSLIVITIMVALVFGISFTLLQTASGISLRQSKTAIRYLTEVQAEHWKGREDAFIRVLRTVASVMEDYESVEPELRRDRYDTLLHGVLAGETAMTSIYTVWRVNGVDGMDSQYIGRNGSSPTGQYAIRYTKDGSVIYGGAMPKDEIDTAVANMDGATAQMDMVFEPVPGKADGKDTYLVKMAIPVINTETGQTVARVGCLLSIDAVQPAVTELLQSHGDEIAAMSIYSQSGFILGSYQSDRVGKNLTDVDTIYGDYIQAAAAAVREGRPFECSSYAPVLGTNVEMVITPFRIGNSSMTWAVMVAATESYILTDVSDLTRFTMIVAGIAILAVAAIIFLVLQSMTNPIVKITENLKDIAEGEGDLTRTLHINSKDEVGSLAHYFNQTLEKIKNLVITIEHQTGTLFDIGSELSSNMTETAAAINQITANVQNIKGRITSQSVSVTETNTAMEHITVNIDKLNGHVENQSASVVQSSSAIEEMLANIHSVTQTLINNGENVKELIESSEVGRGGLEDVVADIQEIARESEGLLEINSVMESIASQTNLLSMNAAIEAAHAGDVGKGFAVVADEIRKLAENSGEQSKTISTVLKKIKASIDKITASTDNVLKKFELIDSGVKTVAQQEENIRNAMEEQSQGSKQILEAIGRLNEITQQVKEGSTEMFDGSKEVIHESKNLEMMTQEINGGMNEMAAGADQINIAVTRVNEISVKNRENIELLVKEVSRFKVE
ncbi:methyl-accepting chemotaxis protein [Breznakiella homolactica]|uniref:Methyl-accepting chemotaxis protein n=1 Tax=Breznakiella homolactica TaxID=2798577 RepID=A0A7T7XMH2_9SPIR|nr:HAMP domain-containing methyl-accepting chemotaxis protein [Breznakiella homolactica]QQO09074.1 methyl-accepting chemotaxis protein [Breznakiella homolactica]